MAVSNLMLRVEKDDLLHLLPVSYRIKEYAPVRHALSISLFDRRKARNSLFNFSFGTMYAVQSVMINPVIRR